MLRIDISPFKPGVHELELQPEAETLELDPARFRDVHVKVRMDVQERRLLVSLHARALAELECDRTLRLFEQEVRGDFHLLFAPPEFVEGEEEGLADVRPLQPSDHVIEIGDAVRDTILLAIPSRCVAPGAEQEEIPTVFGGPEDGVDPRWDALRKLRSDSE